MRNADPRKINRKHRTPNSSAGDALNRAYSDQAGALKTSDVGHKLEPIADPNTAPGFTTNATTARKIGMGCTVAVWATSASTVTFGAAGVASLAAGVCSANGSVGIPLAANTWTYLNSFQHEWIITAASAMVFIVADDTYASDNVKK